MYQIWVRTKIPREPVFYRGQPVLLREALAKVNQPVASM